MRVLVRHGHFAFFPRGPSDIARFARIFDEELVRVGDYYTFEALSELPRYSLIANLFGNLPAITTYEGRSPWEVMRENDFVYNVALGLLVPKLSIVSVMQAPRSDSYFISPTPLIQPGTRDSSGQQVLSYDADFNQDLFQLKVLEVFYE